METLVEILFYMCVRVFIYIFYLVAFYVVEIVVLCLPFPLASKVGKFCRDLNIYTWPRISHKYNTRTSPHGEKNHDQCFIMLHR